MKPTSTFFRLFSFLKGSWAWVFGSIALGALTISASIGLLGTSSYLISMAALHPSIAVLQVAIVGVRFFGIMRGVFRYSERLVSHNVTFRLLAKLRAWFYEALEPLAPARLMQYRSGDLLARIIGDVETLENFYVRAVAPPLVALIVTLWTSLFLGSFHPSLGFSLLGFLLLLGVIAPLLTQLVARQPGRALIERRAEIQAQVVDGVQGLADLIAFGRQADRQNQIARKGETYAVTQRRMTWITSFNNGLSVLLTNLGMWVVLVLAIPLVVQGLLPGYLLASMALITLAAFEAVSPLPQAAQMLGSSLAAAQRLFDVVDAPPVVTDAHADESARVSRGEVRFENVSFRYGASDPEALREVSFALAAGKHLAVVGPSGSGKSTLVNLLFRFWDSENITLDGHALRTLTQDEARRALAVVSQNAYFFNATVKQNLLLAKPKATDAEIEAAARTAQIHDFILSLPQGYETWIGERGLRLSGGERQRLAIARALLKDAPVLILDEPTANLDPLTERAVLATLFEVMKARATLLITHRLVGLEHFDEIIVLDEGRVFERGTHADLSKRDGLYRHLLDLQNRILAE